MCAGLQKRVAHEGEDFEKMSQHLHHAFDVFMKRLGEDHVCAPKPQTKPQTN